MIFTRVFDGPTAFRGQAATTRITLANPTDGEIDLRLTYVSGNNEPASTALQGAPEAVSRTLPPQGFLDEPASEIFG